jgi:uncharacterized protein YdeI (YjbR/CyaY-like superfamily)
MAMPTIDPRINAYIAKAPAYAKPILEHLRQLIHKACPGVEETVKWGMPFFDYKGSPLCVTAAFKQYCKFGFWKASLLTDPQRLLKTYETAGMGHIGNIVSLADLPSDKVLLAYLKEAMQLNEAGIKLPARAKTAAPKKELAIPAPFAAALKKNKKAQTAFDAFPPSHRRDYIQWIAEAKTEETRDKRVKQAIEWIAEGKSRNWKYMKK